MRLDAKTILFGLLAGAATALLALSAGEGTAFAFLLLAAATLPILIASLGWGNAAGVVAAVTAFAGLAATLSAASALMFFVTTLLPAAWIGYLANLARPAEEVGGPKDALAWYPLSDIMLHLCALVSIGLVVLGFVVGYGEEIGAEFVDAFVAAIQQQNPGYAPTDRDLDVLKQTFVRAVPLVQGGVWVLILFTAFYLAAAIVRTSGRSRRPKDDIPSNLRMPRPALIVFAIGILLSFFSGSVGLIGLVICGTFGCGFMLAGFAIVHERTRALPWRTVLLWLSYTIVLLFAPAIAVFLLIGLFDTTRRMTLTRPGPPAKT